MPVMLDEFFDSKYLRAADLNGREAKVLISGIEPVKMGDGQKKAILLFQGKKKGLVLNKTNANRIASAYGQDMEQWMDKPLILYADETPFQGQMVPCLRVRVPQAPKAEAGADDPIPF